MGQVIDIKRWKRQQAWKQLKERLEDPNCFPSPSGFSNHPMCRCVIIGVDYAAVEQRIAGHLHGLSSDFTIIDDPFAVEQRVMAAMEEPIDLTNVYGIDRRSMPSVAELNSHAKDTRMQLDLEAINQRRRALGKRALTSNVMRQNPANIVGATDPNDYWIAYNMPGDMDQPAAASGLAPQQAQAEAALGVDGKQHISTEDQQKRQDEAAKNANNPSDPEGKTTGGGIDGNSKSAQAVGGAPDRSSQATNDKNDGQRLPGDSIDDKKHADKKPGKH